MGHAVGAALNYGLDRVRVQGVGFMFSLVTLRIPQTQSPKP